MFKGKADFLRQQSSPLEERSVNAKKRPHHLSAIGALFVINRQLDKLEVKMQRDTEAVALDVGVIEVGQAAVIADFEHAEDVF